MLIGLLIALVAMLLTSVGALLQASGAQRATRSRPAAVQPRYIGGLLVDLIAWLCAVAALRVLPVFAVQAILGGSIAVTAVVGARINNTVLDRTTRVTVAVCLVGLVLVAASAGAGHPPVTSTLVNYVLIGALLVLGVLMLVLRTYRRAWPLAIVAGMGLGGTALAVRAAHVEIGEGFSFTALLGQPSIYLIAGYWAVGIIAYSAALARGEVGIVTAVFIVTEVVVPGLVGILLLGDPVRAGWGWIFVIGLAISMIGVVVLARRPPPRPRRVRRAGSVGDRHRAGPELVGPQVQRGSPVAWSAAEVEGAGPPEREAVPRRRDRAPVLPPQQHPQHRGDRQRDDHLPPRRGPIVDDPDDDGGEQQTR